MPEFTAAAMFSTAYLTDRDAERTAGACLVAIAAAAPGRGARADETSAGRAGRTTAERWAGADACPRPGPTRSWPRPSAIPRIRAGAREAAAARAVDPRLADGPRLRTGAARGRGAGDDARRRLIEAARALVRAASRHDG